MNAHRPLRYKSVLRLGPDGLVLSSLSVLVDEVSYCASWTACRRTMRAVPRGCLILPDLMVGEVTRSALAAPFGRSPFPFILLAD